MYFLDVFSSLQLVPVLSQINPFEALPFYSVEIRVSIILLLTPRFSKLPFLQVCQITAQLYTKI